MLIALSASLLYREQKKFEVNEITFEDMLDRLEKNSGHNVVSAKVCRGFVMYIQTFFFSIFELSFSQEAKLLLKEDDELILAVYDYWVDKRLRLKQPLVSLVCESAFEKFVKLKESTFLILLFSL